LHSRFVPELARLTAELRRVEAENSQAAIETTDHKFYYHNNSSKPEANQEATRLAKKIPLQTTKQNDRNPVATDNDDGSQEAIQHAAEISLLITENERLMNTEVRLEIEAAHFNDTIARLTTDLDRATKERDDYRRNCDNYKTQLAGFMEKARQVEDSLAVAHQQTSENLKDIVQIRGQGVNDWRLEHIENQSNKVLESITSATETTRLMQ